MIVILWEVPLIHIMILGWNFRVGISFHSDRHSKILHIGNYEQKIIPSWFCKQRSKNIFSKITFLVLKMASFFLSSQGFSWAGIFLDFCALFRKTRGLLNNCEIYLSSIILIPSSYTMFPNTLVFRDLIYKYWERHNSMHDNAFIIQLSGTVGGLN